MIIVKTAADVQDYLQKILPPNASTGFVPTMGALHEGHLSLIRTSRMQNAITVCSIFVNPTQFNNARDFEKYPITIERDIDLLEKEGCDLLFLPSVEEIYTNGTGNLESYPLGYLETLLEGKYRPGHFQGVCQVVNRLLTMVRPQFLYLGQKDYQQCMVIKRLIELMEAPIQLVICPTLRETDGLAMSSRNMRLNAAEKEKALCIYTTLSFIKKEIRPGYLEDLKLRAAEYLTAEGFKVDYVEIANSDTLEPQQEWDGRTKLVALIAAFLNEVRLIDNMPLNF